MAKLRTRPTGDLSKDDVIVKWDKEVQQKSGGKSSYRDLVLQMHDPSLARDPETGLKELGGGPWPLRVPSIHHWSSKTLKNLKRDVPKHALAALIEVFVVAEYRPKLLLESAAARFLRTCLHKTLDYGLKKRKGSAGLQTQGRIKWTYPDGVGWEQTWTTSRSDASKLLTDHSCILDVRESGQEVVGLLGRILQHKAAHVKLGDPACLGVVAPEVSRCVHNLLDVWPQHCLTQASRLTLSKRRP